MAAETTDRFALPLLQAGQAQKEMSHNEALVRIGMLLHPQIESRDGNAPPETPLAGQCWLVGDMPEGDWAGQAQALAMWTDNGWRFVAAREGMAVWYANASTPVRFSGGIWRNGVAGAALMVDGEQVVGARLPGVAAPIGGTVVDTEARSAITGLLDALRTHGLIDPE